MVSRRGFLKLAAGGMAVLTRDVKAAETGATFRSISYNVLAFRGFPDNASTRARIKERCDRHPQMTAGALAAFSPDIVTLQEGPAEKEVARFAQALNMRYAYFPGGWGGDANYPGGFPGAIVTRFDIEESRNRPSAASPHDETLFTRHLGSARLATPFGPLHVVTTHFHAHDHTVRMREAAAIVALTAQLRASGPVLLQGDLNHSPQDPEYAVWVEAGLVDIGKTKGIGDQPTAPSVRPRRRIDYIWSTPELAEKAMAAAVLDKPPFVTEANDPSSYALSDHMPVMVEFRRAK